ncbi:MAG TPA: phosphoribosylanthranilate isomerase [Kiritimatiellia bacterium]|nr:phosphoribosylanthranilate isomerase [Kiritimatiellia bacterium]
MTEPETARFCVAAGVGALGAVFYANSPRCVTPEQARALFEGLPAHIARVGVFVNCTPDDMLATARIAGLTTLQLHGQETRADIEAGLAYGYRVIKVLTATGDRLLKTASSLPSEAGILVECGTGSLPGGNGAVWNWADAAPLAALRPFALAGGLDADNIVNALRLSGAVAYDVSSGVEIRPGVKSHALIRTLTHALRAHAGETRAPSFWLPAREPRSEVRNHPPNT